MAKNTRKRGGRTPTRRDESQQKRPPPEPQRAVPPPRDELEPEPPPVRPGSDAGPGLVTRYPDRSEWERDVSERSRRAVAEGKRPPRTKGPTTEAS